MSQSCRLIAEIGANHLGNLDIACAMIDAAADAGCDTVKFQSWRPEKLVKSFPDYDAAFARHSRGALSDQAHVDLIAHCRARDVRFLTTCFDLDRVDFLASLGLDEIKIASPDCASPRLIERLMARFPKLIISTGMTDDANVAKTIDMVKGHDVVMLHCVSLYPTPRTAVNLARMHWLGSQGVRAGFSDHTMGPEAAMMAVAQGAAVVEKHFTLSRQLPGKDQTISGEPDEFRAIADWIRAVDEMTGQAHAGLSDEERRLQGIYVGKWGSNA